MVNNKIQDRTYSAEDSQKSFSAVDVDRNENCFAGMIIGLPLSILSWIGIFSLVDAAQKIIF